MTEVPSINRELLGRLDWQSTRAPEAATGYEAVVEALERAGLPTNNVRLIAAVIAHNAIDPSQLQEPLAGEIEIPSLRSFTNDWADIARSRDMDALVSAVGRDHLRNALDRIQPAATDAQAALQVPSLPPGRNPLPSIPVDDVPALPVQPEDPGRTSAAAIANERAVEIEQAEAYASQLAAELRSPHPDHREVGRLVQQLMGTGDLIAAARGGDVDRRIAALELYNRVVGAPDTGSNDIERYALIRQLRATWDADTPEFLIPMAFIRNESAQFENEDYVYFLYRGWTDSIWWWGEGEHSLEDIYSELRDPDLAAGTPDARNVERVNLRYLMKYGNPSQRYGGDAPSAAWMAMSPGAGLGMAMVHARQAEAARLSAYEQRMVDVGITGLDDENVARRYRGVLEGMRPPLAQLAERELGDDLARRVRVIPYAERTVDDRALTPAYELALRIAGVNPDPVEPGQPSTFSLSQDAVLDAVERIHPAGSDHPAAWDRVEDALRRLAESGELVAANPGTFGNSTWSVTPDTSLDALIRRRIDGDHERIYTEFLSQENGRTGRFGLDEQGMAAYVAERIYHDEFAWNGDDEQGALQRYERYLIGGETDAQPGMTRYREVMRVAAERDGIEIRDLHDRVADGADARIRRSLELLAAGEPPDSDNYRLQRIMRTDDRHELRQILGSMSPSELLGLVTAAEGEGNIGAQRLLEHVAHTEHGPVLNGTGDDGQLVPTPGVARLLVALAEVPDGPLRDEFERYHPAAFEMDQDGAPVGVSLAVDLTAALYWDADSRVRVNLARQMPLMGRENVLDSFEQLQAALGRERSLRDAYADTLTSGNFERVEAYLEPIDFSAAGDIDARVEQVREMLRVQVGGMATRFTHEHGALRIRIQELEETAERIVRRAAARGEADPNLGAPTQEEIQELNDAVVAVFRASINTRQEIEDFDESVREVAIWTAAIVGSAATMGLGTAGIAAAGTWRVGSVVVPRVVQAAIQTSIATGTFATAADLAADGEWDMTSRDYLRVAGISSAMTLGFARLPFVRATEVTAWAPATWPAAGRLLGNYAITGGVANAGIQATDAWHDRRYGDIMSDAGTGFLWGSAIGAGASAVFMAGARALQSAPSLRSAFGFRRVQPELVADDVARSTGDDGVRLLTYSGDQALDEATNQWLAALTRTDEAGQAVTEIPEAALRGQGRWTQAASAADDYARAVIRGGDDLDALALATDDQILAAIRMGDDALPNLSVTQQAAAARLYREQVLNPILRQMPEGLTARNLETAMHLLDQAREFGLTSALRIQRTRDLPTFKALHRMMTRMYGANGPQTGQSLRAWAEQTLGRSNPQLARQLADGDLFELLQATVGVQMRVRTGSYAANMARIGQLAPESFQSFSEAGMRNALLRAAGAADNPGFTLGNLDEWLNQVGAPTRMGNVELTQPQRFLWALEHFNGHNPGWLEDAFRAVGASPDDIVVRGATNATTPADDVVRQITGPEAPAAGPVARTPEPDEIIASIGDDPVRLRQVADDLADELPDHARALREAADRLEAPAVVTPDEQVDAILARVGDDPVALRLAASSLGDDGARLHQRVDELVASISDDPAALRGLADDLRAQGLIDDADRLITRADALDEAARPAPSRAAGADDAPNPPRGPRVPQDQVRVNPGRPIESFHPAAQDAVQGTRRLMANFDAPDSGWRQILRLRTTPADELAEAGFLGNTRNQLQVYLREATDAADDAAAAEINAALGRIDARARELSPQISRRLNELSSFENVLPAGPRRWAGLRPGVPDEASQALARFNRALEVSDELATLHRLSGSLDEGAHNAMRTAARRLNQELDGLIATARQRPGFQDSLARLLDDADTLAQSPVPGVAELGESMAARIQRTFPRVRDGLNDSGAILAGITDRMQQVQALVREARVGRASAVDALNQMIDLYDEIARARGFLGRVVPRNTARGFFVRGRALGQAIDDAERALASAVGQLEPQQLVRLGRIVRRNPDLGGNLRVAVNRGLHENRHLIGTNGFTRADFQPISRLMTPEQARRVGAGARWFVVGDFVLWGSNNALWGMERIPTMDGGRRHVDSVSERVGDAIEDFTPFDDLGRSIENGRGSFLFGWAFGNPGRITY